MSGQEKKARSYCRRDGWRCKPDDRCDEHRIDRDPEHWASRFINGGDFILDGVGVDA